MSASQLPPELLLGIFGAGLSSVDLAHVSRACRHFRTIVEPILYTSVALASTDKVRSFILAIQGRSSRAQAVRSLELDWFDDIVEEEEPPVANGFWEFHTKGAFDDGATKLTDEKKGPTPIDQEADARGMAPELCYAIAELVPSAHVVLLLDMLPRLQSLRVVPSPVEFWFWAAFPNPCDPDIPKRLPQGLLSLESLEVHYGPDFETSDVTELNDGAGYAHVKLICTLLLPNLRRLSFAGEDGDDNEWGMHYTEDLERRGPFVDMDRLKSRSGVTQLELCGTTLLPEHLLPQVLDMLAAPESVHVEQADEFDFAPFDEFLGRPTLRSLTLVEYPDGYFARNPERQPLHTLGKRDHLTHVALPVQALAPFEDGDLVRRVPRGIEHLDLAYPSLFVLDDQLDRLLQLVHKLGERGSRVRRLTVRPILGDSGHLRAACAASGIMLDQEPCVGAPADPFDAYGAGITYRSPLPTYDNDEFDGYDDFGDDHGSYFPVGFRGRYGDEEDDEEVDNDSDGDGTEADDG
ncbi:hypothetical protein AURDEDRAFT_174663 [Auricularia subglabra TFB-10046 SS5]|uniref:F-box domain-containing protein n=1 Tax=Auricularia subglabra (strain TFB-10046 / SS5) TaxID=717982 RepID=J0WU41_AURST|nr:hypothetical protein AURDEDRAFT_174663 [Auricularia subglabra TFB-10046 SS5]